MERTNVFPRLMLLRFLRGLSEVFPKSHPLFQIASVSTFTLKRNLKVIIVTTFCKHFDDAHTLPLRGHTLMMHTLFP